MWKEVNLSPEDKMYAIHVARTDWIPMGILHHQKPMILVPAIRF